MKGKVVLVKCEMNYPVVGLTKDNVFNTSKDSKTELDYAGSNDSVESAEDEKTNDGVEKMCTSVNDDDDDDDERNDRINTEVVVLEKNVVKSKGIKRKIVETECTPKKGEGKKGGSKHSIAKVPKRKKKSTLEKISEKQRNIGEGNETTKEGKETQKKYEKPKVKRTQGENTKALNNVHMQRRILANARERSRVHKLGEAFGMLRDVIPSYSADQKLSKLSILRIAVSYIAALRSVLDIDRDAEAKEVFVSNVNQCTFALQSEFGRAKGVRKMKSQLQKTTKYRKKKDIKQSNLQ